MSDQAPENAGVGLDDIEMSPDPLPDTPRTVSPTVLAPLPKPPAPKLFIPTPIAPQLVSAPVPRPAATPGRDLLWCLPFYKTTNPHTLFSIVSMFDRATAGLTILAGDAMISHTRNKLADRFLKSSFEWSLWVDDDMVLPTGDAAWFKSVTGFSRMPDEYAGLHTVARLRASGKTIVGATYFGRNSEGKPMFDEGINQPGVAEDLRQGPRNEIRATRWVGTGCLLVHRSVFEDIQRKFPELAPPSPADMWQFFSPSQDSLFRTLEKLKTVTDPAQVRDMVDEAARVARQYHLGTGEDVIFSTRARAAGHQPYVDLGLVAGHIGSASFGPYNTGRE